MHDKRDRENRVVFLSPPFLFSPSRENPTIIGAALTQHFLHNEAKWKVQINEDIGVIKIKSWSSYAFLNNEHYGYWRGRKGLFFPINLAHIPDLIQPEPIQCKMQPMAFLFQSSFVLYLCSSGRRGRGGSFIIFFKQAVISQLRYSLNNVAQPY